MTFFRVDPARIFEGKNDGVLPLATTIGNPAVGNNNLVVTAVSGKRIKVMGWILQSNDTAATGAIQLKSASGGTLISGIISCPPWGTGFTEQLPIVECGYMETNTGEGLYVDIYTNIVRYTFFTITYTP